MSVARIAAGAPALGLSELPSLGTESAEGSKATGFGDLLDGVIQDASRAGHVADQKGEALARGALDDIHGTMISAKEAEISLKLVGSIRNKLLDAFHELWRTSV
jgi:flagellar hook-basal body complex protein FliE